MATELERALREVRDELLEQPVSPRVESPRDINAHHCRYVAETVARAVGEDGDVEVLADGGRGYAHTWLYHDGRHYDAECVEGVADHRELPFFRRHPEAVVRVGPATESAARVRGRGREPLYPDSGGRGSAGPRIPARYRRYALAGAVIGLLLLAVGVGGSWAVGSHLLRGGGLGWAFYDATVLGELSLLVSPALFLFLAPALRQRTAG